GYEPGRPGGPQTIAQGRGITRSHFELVADRKTGLVVGDRIRLGRDSFAVVGLVDDVMNSGGDPAAFVTLSDSQTLQSQLPPPAQRVQTARGAGLLESADTVAAVIARLEPTANPLDVARTVQQWKHLGALTQAE